MRKKKQEENSNLDNNSEPSFDQSSDSSFDQPFSKRLFLIDFWGTMAEYGHKDLLRTVQYELRIREPFPVFVEKFEQIFMTKKTQSLKEGFEDVIKAFNLRTPAFVIDKLIGIWNTAWIKSTLYEGILDAIRKLRQHGKVVLVHNTDIMSGTGVIGKFSLDKEFDEIALSCNTGKLKRENFKDLVKKYNPEEIFVVGDSLHSDIQGANDIGAQGILIDRKGLKEYDKKVTSLAEVPSFLGLE